MCEFFYGECSVMASTKHLQCFRGVRISHSPQIKKKIMEQWQMWSLQRTENPKELDRNQPAPQQTGW